MKRLSILLLGFGSTFLFAWAAQATDVDLDLTRGNAGAGEVTGGEWTNDWMRTGAMGERIVFDAGRPIANERFEVTFRGGFLRT